MRWAKMNFLGYPLPQNGILFWVSFACHVPVLSKSFNLHRIIISKSTAAENAPTEGACFPASTKSGFGVSHSAFDSTGHITARKVRRVGRVDPGIRWLL